MANSKDAKHPSDGNRIKTPSFPGGNAHWKPCLVVVSGLFILDHITKFWAIAALRPSYWNSDGMTLEQWNNRPAITVVPGLLRFVYAENKGAAFSILDGYVGVLAIISVLAAAALIWFWRSLPADQFRGRIAVALVFSGAVGNLVDRVFRGYVVDFIDAYWRDHHWPTFNIADSCICVGGGMLILLFARGKI